MTRIDRREHHMRHISENVTKASGPLPARTQSHHVPDQDNDRLPYTNPKDRYHISSAQKYPLHIGEFLRDNRGDPALKVDVFSVFDGW
jgi:hypothetical protein